MSHKGLCSEKVIDDAYVIVNNKDQQGSASIKRVSNFTKRDGVDEKKSTGCKEDYWPLYRRSFYEQEDSLIGAKRVSCGVRRRESEDEICGADLILESASVSSSS
ncbi:hypothetical protein YC2023_019325 [Brassica napus]